MQTIALNGRIEQARSGQMGLDMSQVLHRRQAVALRRMGFAFCLRYLSRGAPGPEDLTAAEAAGILAAGLSLMAVQHVAPGRWVPTPVLGAAYGAAAVKHAQLVGLPGGVNVWLDLESVQSGTPAEDVIGYCNAWFRAVTDAGYVPGVYVGFDPGLSSEDLFWRLRTQHYWAAASHVPEVFLRGYQMHQSLESKIEVIEGEPPLSICRDVCREDGFGLTPVWLAPADNPL